MGDQVVKYRVGLHLAKAGIRSFAEAARTIGISQSYLANILACREQPPKHQQALARLCGCDPEHLFGRCTHPRLRSPSAAEWNGSA